MRRILLFALSIGLLISCFWGKLAPRFYAHLPIEWQTKEMIYSRIHDLHHPTESDYRLIQHYLKRGNRKEFAHLKEKIGRARKPLLVGKKEHELPQFTVLHVNNPECKKENCLILYSSFNKNFVGGLKRIVELVEKSDFRGDILYRLGGWPNVEGGDLTLAHVPYSFKICFFREAQRLGYKRAFWLDSAITPLVSLNQIFADIEKRGYFVMGNGHKVGPYFNELSAKALGVTLDQSFEIPSCSAGIFGVDFSDARACKALEMLYAAAKDQYAFFSHRWDQNALSVILYKLQMQEMADIKTLAHGKELIDADSLFLIDRGFVQKWKD